MDFVQQKKRIISKNGFEKIVTTEIMRRAARMVLCFLPQGSEDGPAWQDDVLANQDASLRAGHPGHCRLPPLYPPPPSGAG